ncbi:MAG: hypothetical protein ABFD54_05685 [Armatimonadota bacterium]
MKGASSHLVTHSIRPCSSFKWQGGYGAFAVSKSMVTVVRDYIMHQESHHADGTTQRDMEVAWESYEG